MSSGSENYQPAPAAKPRRKIHVVIVAVPEFAIATYNTTVVHDSLLERCEFVKNYFTGRLGDKNVQIDQFCTKELTTRERLRRLFEIEIPAYSANTVTLLFVMSHGEQITFDNSFHDSDVELIASDTQITDDGADKDHTRQFSSILVGSEMLNWLQDMPAGSTLLAFLDFCHSGAVGSVSSSLLGYLQQQFGLRALVMTSSLPGDGTYRALFTKDLLESWDSSTNQCLSADAIGNAVYEKMKAEAPLSGNEGIPDIPIRYQGPLCLGNFGGDHRLLFIYAGQGAEKHPYHYTIAEEGILPKAIINNQPIKAVYWPVLLDAKKYIVNLERDGVELSPISVDLSSAPSDFIWLDDHPTMASVGRTIEIMADIGERNGLSRSEVDSIRMNAVSAYSAAGLKSEADRILVSNPLTRKPQAQLNAFVAMSGSASLGTSMSVTLAEDLETFGDIAGAAKFYERAANSETDHTLRFNLATQSYYAYLASGSLRNATRVRLAFKTEKLSDSIRLTQASQNLGTNESFRALALAKLLGAKTSTLQRSPTQKYWIARQPPPVVPPA